MSPPPAVLSLHVAEARLLNPLVKLFRLRAEGGGVLPGYSAGAHLRVRVELAGGASDWRHYSLINLAAAAGATDAPTEYLFAVRLESAGKGGSRHLHEQVHAGDALQVEPPKNDFPLQIGTLDAVRTPAQAQGQVHAQAPAQARRHGTLLLAGGIGVTPLISMAAQCRAEGAPVRMVYAGRSREAMAFLPELQALLGDDLRVHADAEAGAPLAIPGLLDELALDESLYVCGPKPMLDAVLAQAHARGWAPERVHFELFTPPVAEAGDRPFELVLAQSGQTFTVAADQTILECLIDQGCDPMFDCKRGECGVCATAVIEGEIDHRDYVLSVREKAAGKLMHICISRAKGPRLVLDL